MIYPIRWILVVPAYFVISPIMMFGFSVSPLDVWSPAGMLTSTFLAFFAAHFAATFIAPSHRKVAAISLTSLYLIPWLFILLWHLMKGFDENTLIPESIPMFCGFFSGLIASTILHVWLDTKANKALDPTPES